MNGRQLEFFVPGVPQPGGSKRGFVVPGKTPGSHRAIITDDAKGNKNWRASVKQFALEAWKAAEFEAPFSGPLELKIVFSMPRLKGHYGTGKNAANLKPSAPQYVTKKPDTTKLIRSTEDALTDCRIWLDDSQVAHQEAWRIYADHPGAHITIAEMHDSPY